MTTTFWRRVSVVFARDRSFFFLRINIFIKNRLLILFEQTRRQTRISTRIERRFWSRRRRIDDLTLRRRRLSAFSLIERLVKEIIEWSTVKILQSVTVWVQIYTYRSADWSMILQSSLLFFYITSISWRFEFIKSYYDLISFIIVII
jgi:hypothetical protein